LSSPASPGFPLPDILRDPQHQHTGVPLNEPDASQTTSLRKANAGAAVLHAVQAVTVLAIATDFALPVTASYMAGPPGTTPLDRAVLFDISTGAAVAGFLALSALAHLIVCTAWWQRYVVDLGRQRNPARWVEYSLSSSLMIVLIAQLVGISDVAALVALFGVNVAMILFGWLQERYEHPGSGRLAAVRLRVCGRCRPVAGHLGLPPLTWLHVLGLASRFRLRDLRVAVRLLQRLRPQPVAAVPRQGTLAELLLRREGLHRAEPYRQVCPGVADLCRHTGRMTATCQGDQMRVGVSGWPNDRTGM